MTRDTKPPVFRLKGKLQLLGFIKKLPNLEAQNLLPLASTGAPNIKRPSFQLVFFYPQSIRPLAQEKELINVSQSCS